MIKTKKYFASQIAKIVDGELIGKDCEIEFISTDSREEHLNKSCFFPLSGERYNGEEYIEEAILKGASLVISSKKSSQNASLICVSDVKKAFLRLASYNKGNTKIIGITGSNGKTTVKEMVKSIAERNQI